MIAPDLDPDLTGYDPSFPLNAVPYQTSAMVFGEPQAFVLPNGMPRYGSTEPLMKKCAIWPTYVDRAVIPAMLNFDFRKRTFCGM